MSGSSKQNCRVCMGEGSMISVFQELHSFRISSKIESLTGVKINPEDSLPSTICRRCVKSLENCLKFIQLCQDSDLKYRTSLGMYAEIENSYCKVLEETSSETDSMNDLLIDENTSETKINQSECINKEISMTDFVNKEPEKITKNTRKAVKQQCFTCGKIMSSRFRLKTHMRIHTGERPFSCPHCGKTFALTQNLKVHLRTHTGEKPLVCVDCGASFAQSAGLAVHRRKHTGAAPYVCALCPRAFRTPGHLQYHVRRHTGEKKFECNTCSRAFITRSDLKQHLISHTGDKPHVCCICGLRLTRASHLRRHIQLIHKGEKPFSCSICSANFTKKTDLEKHKMKHSKKKVVEGDNK